MNVIDLLSRADPARTVVIDSASFRAQVDTRIEGSVPVSSIDARRRRPWLTAVVAFVVVIAVFIPAALTNRAAEPPSLLRAGVPEDLFGVDATVGLDGGGVKTVAVDGSTIWVMNALQRSLVRVDAASREIRARYEIDAYVEGVAVGGGYVWLASYDNGGGLLRFDPTTGEVDVEIPTQGAPSLEWFDDSLWMSTEAGGLFRVSAAGAISSVGRGVLKGKGLGMLWIYDPGSRSILGLTEDGEPSGIEIPPDSPALGENLADVDGVVEVREHLWLVVGGGGELAPGVIRFDPGNGELLPLDLIPGVRAGAVFDGALWLPSYTEHLLVRVDPVTGDTSQFALPGRPGTVFLADGGLWVALYQPGTLAILDVDRLVPAGDRIVDQTVDGGRLVCTSGSSGSTTRDSTGLATAVLDPSGWIGYASWSMVQAELSALGVTSCAFGFPGDPRTPAERAAGMAAALATAGVDGPLVVVAAMDGVHSTRLFADGRDDIAALVLVDPMPLGFEALYDQILPGWGHPPWADLDVDAANGLDDFGATPLVVIGQDPNRTFLKVDFRRAAGEDVARRLNDAWQVGLDSYSRLSSNSTGVTAAGSGLDMIVWEQPDMIARQVLQVLLENP